MYGIINRLTADSIRFDKENFFVKKDTTAPTIDASGQSGDDTWRSDSTTAYNVDFDDTGGSNLERFRVQVSTDAGGSGAVLDQLEEIGVGGIGQPIAVGHELVLVLAGRQDLGDGPNTVRLGHGVGRIARRRAADPGTPVRKGLRVRHDDPGGVSDGAGGFGQARGDRP